MYRVAHKRIMSDVADRRLTRHMLCMLEGSLDSVFHFLEDLGLSEDEIMFIAEGDCHEQLVEKVLNVKDN